MRTVKDNVWLCVDCMLAAVNDDYSGLDYSYSQEDASELLTRMQEGWQLLGTWSGNGLVKASAERETRMTCACCRRNECGTFYEFNLLGPEVA